MTKTDKSKRKEEITLDVSLRWNRDGKSCLCRGYEKRFKFSSQRHSKLARDF